MKYFCLLLVKNLSKKLNKNKQKKGSEMSKKNERKKNDKKIFNYENTALYVNAF